MWPRKSSTKNNQTFISSFLACFQQLSDFGNAYHLLCLKFLTFSLLIIAGECLTEGEKARLLTGNQQLVSGPCVNFSNGFAHSQLDGEFFSPGYSGNYPNNNSCLRVIEAPYGYVIRLEFRERFDVEPSTNCQHDYLQIRDGAHGYSRLIGQFCGHTFPGELTSSDRHLWLLFVSDDTIEYGGFRIVYKFIKNNAMDRPELQPCSDHLSGTEGVFGTADIPEDHFNYSKTYQVPLNCIWEIEVQPNHQVYLTFLNYELAYPNECDQNFINVFPDLTTSQKIQNFCGSSPESVSSSGNKLYVLYFAETKALKGDFTILFTAFRLIGAGDSCESGVEYDCEDNTCIDINLRCNRNQNCKYKIDEEDCEVKGEFFLGKQQVQIILIVGIGLLLSILVPSCWKCYRKWKDEGEEESPSAAGGEASTQTSMGQRTVEGSLHEQHVMGVVSGNYCGQTNPGANMDDDEHGCYVPEVDLSVFEKRSNGGHAILQDDQLMSPLCGLHEPSLDSTLPFDSADPLIATAPPPPLLPLIPLQLLRSTQNKNQRNSLQDGRSRGAATFGAAPARTSTPPLPPPPPHSYTCPHQDNYSSLVDDSYNSDMDNNNSFLTFLPPPPTLEEVEESDAIFGLPPTASLSGGNRTNNPRQFKAEAVIEMSQRPRSFESTKSAPDVIGRI